jgi:hypothetical protein
MTANTPEHDGEANRWEALVDREVTGEALTDAELTFMRVYEAKHPACAEERELWTLALDLLGDADDGNANDAGVCVDAQLDRIGADALAAFRAEQTSNQGAAPGLSRRTRWQPLAVAATLAAAAGLILWLGTHGDDARLGDAGSSAQADQHDNQHDKGARDHAPKPQELGIRAVDPAGQLSMRTDTKRELGSAVTPGTRLDTSACVSWTNPIAVVCFEGSLELSDSSQLGQRRVHLGEGRLVAALDPLGPGQRFTVDTVLGSVTAVGTVFAVESHEGRVWVTVLEGRVELRDASARLLAAGQRTGMRGEVPGDEPSPIQATPAALEQLVGLAQLLRASSGPAQLGIPAQAEYSLQLDGHALGGGVMDLSLAAGDHRLTVFDTRGERLEERVLTLEAATAFELAGVLASLDAGAGTADQHEPDQPRAAPKQPTPSAKQLAEAAQRERAAGHHTQTASLYRALLEHYPDSPEAVNVSVRLGDLLASTGDHQGALAAYELYLERGAKQLAPEAEIGRVLALRALGRRTDEAAAIASYLRAWPNDYRRPELEARLASLRD